MIESGWCRFAEKCVSPNYDARPSCSEISLLVIHNISLPPAEFGGGFIHQFFTGRLDCNQHVYFKSIIELKVSAHCLIERDGTLTQFVSFLDRAWHAGRSRFGGVEECNDYSIGVELEGTDSLPYTKSQYLCLVHLTKLLMETYPRITCQRIVGHSDVAPNRKTDPGPAFDWSYYKKSLMSVNRA